MSIFSKVKINKPSSNIFDLSHDRKMSLNMGDLVPILALECVPGDKISMSTSQLLRFAPLVTPVMHQVSVYTHFYFVPNRILWDNWQSFITGGEDGLDASVFPTIGWNDSAVGSLYDYMGLPQGSGGIGDIQVSALPFAAYQTIFNEYYRDQNLITFIDVELVDGNNNSKRPALETMRTRAWQHDYFTSALPWTQKGAEATIPLGTTAAIDFVTGQTGSIAKDSTGAIINTNANDDIHMANSGIAFGATDTRNINWDNSASLSADLSTATAATINDLRNAFRLQEWLEKNARGGSRYIESILSHFGVKSSDARLQRPEFLGGGASPVTISEVLQTSAAATEPTPQGNMAGHGISVGANNNFSYFVEEHGYVIGIMSVMPKTAYQQGIPKHFRKFDKFDYFWPSFAHLGEQPIINEEIYFDNDAFNHDVFGYTPRYAEYKYMNSSVHGEFRTTLDLWHMGRIFATRPALNETFITCDPTDRIFAVTTGEKLYAHVYHKIKASRRMPYFGTPNF